MVINAQLERRTAIATLPAQPRSRERLSQQSTLREVMSQFATGITVLTVGGSYCHGMTANAFSSVSLEPPLVMCCVSRAARMHEAIISESSFGVSILGAQQKDVARHFADWRRPNGLAQFDQVDWTLGPRTAAPLICDALAWLECDVREVYWGGDHSIFLGEVLNSTRGNRFSSLLFYGGGYHEADSPRSE